MGPTLGEHTLSLFKAWKPHLWEIKLRNYFNMPDFQFPS